jgi:hypothetical protein
MSVRPLASAFVLLLAAAPALSADADPSAEPPVRFGGSVEAYGQWNANAPSNRITNARGFDQRSGSLTLSNVALDAQWDEARLVGRATLQAGSAPASYMLGEPALPGTATVAASDATLWRSVQQAWAGYRFGERRQFTISAGLFLSPVGPETIPVKDGWHWSRSNLFFSLPFYHSGIRAAVAATDGWTFTGMVCNGWNSVVDSNDRLSVSMEALKTTPTGRFQLLYLGGVERPTGAPEGQPWRHLVDAFAQWPVSPWVELLLHADAGTEAGRLGRGGWLAAAAGSRIALGRAWWLALRADGLREFTGESAGGRSSPMFHPVPWVASATATAEHRPHERASFRLEWRHDRAGGDLYFGGKVPGDGVAAAYVPNRRSQSTVTLGVTTWF